MNISRCTDYTELEVQWHKAIMQIMKVKFTTLCRKKSKTRHVWPEGAAGGNVAESGL